MNVRNFWTIFLKILGIWLVVNGISAITQFISVVSSFSNTNNENSLTILYVVGISLFIVGIYFFVLWLFVFKTSWLIDKLRLQDGFPEEKIESTINYSSIITIATIVIGGLIFVDSLPQFCKQTFSYFQQKKMFIEDLSTVAIFFYLIKTVLGYLLMTNSKVVTNFIEKQIKQNK